MSHAHILVVEDELKIAALIRDFLVADGHRVSLLERGDLALDWIRSNHPDLVLLDLMLPGLDGMAICAQLRSFSTVPVIMITARVEEIDRLLGLEIGADDYLCKPFSLRELVIRVRGLLRRAQPPPAEEIGVVLDSAGFEAHFHGEKLALTPAEFRLLHTLASHPGRAFSRAQLLDALYLDQRIVTDRSVDTHVKNLRRKLAEAVTGADPIESVYGLGYKYVG